MAAVVAVKKEMRKKIRIILNAVSDSAAAIQTTHATNTLLAMPEYKAARRISVYLSMPAGEVNTSDIVRDALEQGKKVFIPYTYNLDNPIDGQPRSIMDMVELSSIKDFESFEADKWGIPTPSKYSISSRANCFGSMGITNGKSVHITDGLDLIVMPGMAFDHSFGRLGHGKGFYDFFLSRCHQATHMPPQSWFVFDRAAASAERVCPHGPVRFSPRCPDHWRWRASSRLMLRCWKLFLLFCLQLPHSTLHTVTSAILPYIESASQLASSYS